MIYILSIAGILLVGSALPINSELRGYLLRLSICVLIIGVAAISKLA